MPTIIKPRWAEPDESSLVKRMLEAYNDPLMLDSKKENAKKKAANYSFPLIGDMFYRRLIYLVDKFKEEKKILQKTS
jgi:hypothetical protein